MPFLTSEPNKALFEKWGPILNHEKFGGPIPDVQKAFVTAALMENMQQEMQNVGEYQSLLSEAPIPANQMAASSSTPGDGAIDLFDPILINMVRRAFPNLIAYDMVGVQPMTGPNGLVFAMRTHQSNQAGTELFYNEAPTDFATVAAGANTLGDKHVGTLPGNSTVSTNLAEQGLYNFADAMATAQAEALSTDSNTAWPEIAISIESFTVTAKSRALKAHYSQELAQDLKAVHGLDAETVLADHISAEMIAEINREIIRTIYVTAQQGATGGYTTAAGRVDLDADSNGRWMVEKFKGLLFHIELEANKVAKDTRRGKGNILICSSDVASALQMAGVLDYAPAMQTSSLNVDDTGNTFAGVINGRMKVYIDPYAGGNFMVVGYKGASSWDAGLYYAPYVPLQMVRAVGQDDFHPRIGFKTRYGVAANPFAQGTTQGNGALVKDSNVYYRRVLVDSLM